MSSQPPSQKPVRSSRKTSASAPPTLPLLFEIGCEEIPARFLADAQNQLGKLFGDLLVKHRLVEEAKHSVQTYSTPRRLVAHVPQVFARQPDTVELVTGPPVKSALDENGNYTRAAEAFAAKQGAEVSTLKRITTPKGEYVALEKSEPGRPAVEVLGKILDALLRNLSFPKSMYWSPIEAAAHVPVQNKFTFVRPIRWVLALLGEGKNAKVIPFEVAGVRSADKTYGHRLSGSRPIQVKGFRSYLDGLRKHMVEPDPAKRRERVQQGLQESLEGSGLRAVADAWLEDWVVNSTEWPRGIVGEFDPRFLELPREILITVMRDHQKYFAVEDSSGQLQPRFVAFLNREDDPKGLIRRGHERVLRARFTDAQFFWDADQKIPLRDRLPLLEKVTYHEKLGSYADKVRRVRRIAGMVCEELRQQGKMTDADSEHALRAVELSKCDLTTHMVQEFTELQGIVGGLYARVQGEPEQVAQAIYEHYLPQSLDDPCPRTVVGAVVSLADKLDSVVSGFGAGLEPSGSSDPFALRRAGNGIIRLSVEALPGLDVLNLVKAVTSTEAFAQGDPLGNVARFLRERTEQYFEARQGLRYDTVRAVVHSFEAWSPPARALERARALEPFTRTEEFQALAAAAKRTRNLLKKSATSEDFGTQMTVNESMLSPGPEQELFRAYRATKDTIQQMGIEGRYEDAFRALAKMRPYVDCFFDKVLVMDNDLALRANRLCLLGELNVWVFSRFADLSQIESTASTSVGAPTVENNRQPINEREAALHDQKGLEQKT